VGRIGGYALPSPWTPTQLGAGLATALVLLAFRQLWAHLPGLGNLLVIILAPCAAGWAVRHARVESRSPLRAAAGAAALLSAPRRGVSGGRPARRPRPARLAGRVFTTPPVDAVRG
jgi:hypothetical protein